MIRWQISHSLATRAENASGDWHDLWECVNLASTRWINAIIGQTWRGENPFKARKAKQGPWLIHLANLRVMYECQGTLVRRGREVNVCWLSGFFPCACDDASWLRRSLLETRSSLSPPLCRLGGQNKWSLDREMTKRCTEGTEWEGSGIALQMRWGNMAVVCWPAEWVPACFAVPRAQSGPVDILKVKRLLCPRATVTACLWYNNSW